MGALLQAPDNNRFMRLLKSMRMIASPQTHSFSIFSRNLTLLLISWTSLSATVVGSCSHWAHWGKGADLESDRHAPKPRMACPQATSQITHTRQAGALVAAAPAGHGCSINGLEA